MEVIPAIDLKGGQCVRLWQGRFDRATVYHADPVAVAREFEAAGAPRLHLVDLDGAQSGRQENREAVRAVLQAVRIPVQLGGGLRRTETAEAWLAAGVDRVVMGTLAVARPASFADFLQRVGSERVVLAVDARKERVVVRGWQTAAELTPAALAARFKAAGLRRVLYTAVARDGTLRGPDLEGLAALAQDTGLRVIASGGVASADDVRALAALQRLGVEAVVVGRAFYEGRLRPEEVWGGVG